MIYRTLTAREDDSTGETGLSLDGVVVMESYPSVAMEGRLIAHDILEHQNGLHNIGSIGDELEALGGVWFVRGQWGDITRDHNVNSAEQHVASDVMNMAMLFADGVGFHYPVPNTYSHYQDDSFQCIIDLGRKDYRAEWECSNEDNPPPIPEYFNACLHYMRSGYNKANRRFGNGSWSNNLFWEIAEAVDPYAKHIDYEGQRFRLGYDSNQVTCCEIIEDEEYLY